ncbi:unnamed protein product [Sphenostylis stenocarpa]|uniref:Uncharacterized protein n=1 Tax=Sphenostylis stenocarpa TaxID=92480 RepID=A0AA86S4T8_9FABA|nr:unnamed protein product [Sphenostylis stenocarpa]
MFHLSLSHQHTSNPSPSATSKACLYRTLAPISVLIHGTLVVSCPSGNYPSHLHSLRPNPASSSNPKAPSIIVNHRQTSLFALLSCLLIPICLISFEIKLGLIIS